MWQYLQEMEFIVCFDLKSNETVNPEYWQQKLFEVKKNGRNKCRQKTGHNRHSCGRVIVSR